MRPVYVIGFLLLIFLASAFYFYPSLPDSMASHWNAAGEVDGFMGKFDLHLLLVGLTFFLILVFLAIPRIDPLKKNLQDFIRYYWGFVYLFQAYMLYVYLLIVFSNIGSPFNMTFGIMPGVAALFLYLGWIMPKMKRNWFIGIRTPWTLSSDKVWAETHRVGGKIFMLIGLAFILLMFLPGESILYVVILILLAAFGVAAYSYFAFQRLEKK